MKMLFGMMFAALVAATPAHAQQTTEDGPAHLSLGAGFAIPVSAVSDRFSTGGGFNIGVIIEMTPIFDIQGEYSYNGMIGQARRVPLSTTPGAASLSDGIINSHHGMHYLNLNGVLKPSGDMKVKPYAVGGGGMYFRTVSLTTPDVGFTTFCDPYWYACYPSPVAIDRVIGSRSNWDPGMDVGGGVSVRVSEAAVFFVESRWHYVWGSTVTNADGVAQKLNGQYVPVTLGFRF